MRAMPRRRLPAAIGLPLAVALSLTILGACTDTGGAPTSLAPTPAANATVAPSLPTDVNALPSMDVSGFQALLAELKGTPVVVNLWASWCDPCKRETPKLVAAAKAHPDVQFLGVDVKDSRGGAVAFIGSYGIPYPSVFDPAGAILTEQAALGPPVTLFVAADGTVGDTVKGELSQGALDDGLARIAP